MSTHPPFNLTSPRDFFAEVVFPQYEEFLTDNSSIRRAILAVITAYHLIDWKYPTLSDQAGRYKKQHGGDFDISFEHQFRLLNPSDEHIAEYFTLARKITNGVKHFKQGGITHIQSGFSSEFSAAFQRPLTIERVDGTELSVDELLQKLIDFWKRTI